ncbi:putative disease resistance protein RGA4 [Carex rostrata]
MITVAGIFEKLIEVVLAQLLNVFPSLIANLPTKASARAELDKLHLRANRIWARLADAEQKYQIEDESVLLWLSELRSIAFDTEDLENEFEARARIATEASYWALLSSAWYYWCVLSQVDEINKKYDTIYKDREAQMLPKGDQARVVTTTRRANTRQTGSLEGVHTLHGRHEERERLIDLLLQDLNNRYFPRVLSITGEGGMGKTALAQSAFNNPRITDHFEPLIWVSLSPNSDPVETIRKIIEGITETNCNLSTLDVLQRRLQQLLSGKCFLLVLDGVYTEDLFFWETVRAPLNTAQSGSKILVTTRNKKTAQFMGSSDQDQVALTGLNSTSLWLILKDEAFLQISTSNKNLENIGKDIAAKCYGSPIAAKLLGRTLCGITDKEEWQRLLGDMPDPDEVVDNILPTLKLSYELLTLPLKRCFAYCSIFPKGYEFDRDNLIKLWVSEGLAKSERHRESRTPEDIGKKQFTDLLWRSFFQPCGRNRYVMPGAIHDLCQSVSVYECARGGHSGIQYDKHKMVRYASLCGDRLNSKSVDCIYEMKRLRTLIVYTVGHVPVKDVLQQNLSSNLKFLRSLDLSNCKFDNLHESIGNLIHLRYLNLCGSLFKTLPDSICKLLNLQTLNLDECYNLKELPKGMSSLINMRHIGLSLDWEKWDEKDFDSMPPHLGRLTSLQTLSRFAVAKGDGCYINELRELNLRGVICISKLENVKNGHDAALASLYRKKHLDFLILRWSAGKCSNSDNEEVIRQLEPSREIKSIWIEGYNGSEFPSWVSESSFRNLETLKLFNCKVCVNLPQVAKLPQIKNLYLMGLDMVKDLNQLVGQSADSGGFQSLKLLHLSDMPKLERWFMVRNGSLTNLCDLCISNCPKLAQIPYLPSSLSSFQIRNCQNLLLLPSTVPSLKNIIVEGVDWKIIGWIQTITSLTSLSLIKVPNLRYITGANLSGLSGLTKLKIDGCNKLISIARTGGLQYLPSLKKLDISCCEMLKMFCDRGLPCRIEELHLKGLKSLESLPNGMNLLCHLHTLEIHDVPMLSSVPMMPSSLRFLSISECRDLERRCEIGGPDRLNVENVNCLLIGDTPKLR